MKKYKELSEMIGVSRPSVGRIVKREGINSVSKYDKETRKIIKLVSDEDAETLVKKYRKDER